MYCGPLFFFSPIFDPQFVAADPCLYYAHMSGEEEEEGKLELCLFCPIVLLLSCILRTSPITTCMLLWMEKELQAPDNKET